MGKPGRPRKYNDPEKMKSKIKQYFAQYDPDDDNSEIPTVLGLAIFLGFDGYKSFYDYEHYDGFCEIVKGAKARCGIILNDLALKRKVDGRIASLNLASNHGFREKKEITGEDGAPLYPNKIVIEFED